MDERIKPLTMTDERLNFVANKATYTREAGEAIRQVTFFFRDFRPIAIQAVYGFADQGHDPEEIRYTVCMLPVTNPSHRGITSYGRRAIEMAIREVVGNGDDVEATLHAISELQYGEALFFKRELPSGPK